MGGNQAICLSRMDVCLGLSPFIPLSIKVSGDISSGEDSQQQKKRSLEWDNQQRGGGVLSLHRSKNREQVKLLGSGREASKTCPGGVRPTGSEQGTHVAVMREAGGQARTVRSLRA